MLSKTIFGNKTYITEKKNIHEKDLNKSKQRNINLQKKLVKKCRTQHNFHQRIDREKN